MKHTQGKKESNVVCEHMSISGQGKKWSNVAHLDQSQCSCVNWKEWPTHHHIVHYQQYTCTI